jgi:hypothetical protein
VTVRYVLLEMLNMTRNQEYDYMRQLREGVLMHSQSLEAWFSLVTWTLRRYVLPKHRQTNSRLHGVKPF